MTEILSKRRKTLFNQSINQSINQSNPETLCLHQGPTSSTGTGPSSAKSGSYYLYAESSSPVSTGTTFHYVSPYIKGKLQTFRRSQKLRCIVSKISKNYPPHDILLDILY